MQYHEYIKIINIELSFTVMYHVSKYAIRYGPAWHGHDKYYLTGQIVREVKIYIYEYHIYQLFYTFK